MKELKDLRIYSKALELVGKTYCLIRNNNSLQKDYSLCDQLKRASVSVPANISEGYFRSTKQSQNYLHIASGSANEMMTLLRVVQLVNKIDTTSLIEEYLLLAKQIIAFSKSF